MWVKDKINVYCVARKAAAAVAASLYTLSLSLHNNCCNQRPQPVSAISYERPGEWEREYAATMKSRENGIEKGGRRWPRRSHHPQKQIFF